MTRDFWRDKKVFVTGNTGFKGSWLSLWLAHVGARVQGYSLKPPTKPSLFELAKVGEVVPTIEGDIRDLPRLSAEMAKFGPDIVLHLAAQTVVLSAYEDPIETFSTNVVGTASVFESVKRLPGKCTVVNITTDKVYENVHWVWGYRENDRLGGRDPYSASKAGAEMVAHAYRESFFGPQADGTHRIAMANARAGNVIPASIASVTTACSPTAIAPTSSNSVDGLSMCHRREPRTPTAITPAQPPPTTNRHLVHAAVVA